MGGGVGLVLGLIAVVFVQHAAGQTVHDVGGTAGWSVPQGGAGFYSNWASDKTFAAGDSLRFNFRPANAHDVLELETKQLFDACSFNNTDDDIKRTSPVVVILDDPGMHYFICTIGTHCSLGQKLSINVTATAAGGPMSPSLPRPPSSLPPPSPSSTNAVIGSLYVTLLSAIVMSLLI